MKISAHISSLLAAGCNLHQLKSDDKISDMFPRLRVIFPTDEVFVMEFDKDNMLAVYDSDVNKWYAGDVAKLFDSHKIDYAVR